MVRMPWSPHSAWPAAENQLDWTVVRPARLTDRPATGRYRTAVNRHLPRGRTISRADLAAAMLSLLDDPAAVRSTVGVAYMPLRPGWPRSTAAISVPSPPPISATVWNRENS